jgi:hypothetical protein
MRKSMSIERYLIDATDKPGFLLAMMKHFAGPSLISFEGSLGTLSFSSWPNASLKETEALKRQTRSPKLDFVVLLLNEGTVKDIWRELSEKDHLVHEGVVHVQIESDGQLVFGGYDNFHRDCTVINSGVSIELLEQLKHKGLVRGYQKIYA